MSKLEAKLRMSTWYWGKYVTAPLPNTSLSDYEPYYESTHGWHCSDEARAEHAKLPRVDTKQLDEIEVDGIDTKDAPDFCDAYISHATYKPEFEGGRDLTDAELDQLNEDGDFVYEQVINRLY